MKLPRHAEIWLPGYLADRTRALLNTPPQRLWLAITDHFEPFWRNTDEDLARQRVAAWSEYWPRIADRYRDADGRPARYSFFYPEEEYRPDIMDSLARLTAQGYGDVEIHIHHDRESRQQFLDCMSGFMETLRRHGLLRQQDGRTVFGFIHGNWALDNSRPDGAWCGLNDEITLLAQLGCYADFTMPSGPSPTLASVVNQIYWVRDDPQKPKSYDTGIPLKPGGSIAGDLLMITGPVGVRWSERLIPRLEWGEIAAHDLATPYRVRRWLDLAPRIGADIFLKLHTHGAQDKTCKAFLEGGGLDTLYRLVAEECARRSIAPRFVTAWEMFNAVDALRRQIDPVAAINGVLR